MHAVRSYVFTRKKQTTGDILCNNAEFITCGLKLKIIFFSIIERYILLTLNQHLQSFISLIRFTEVEEIYREHVSSKKKTNPKTNSKPKLLKITQKTVILLNSTNLSSWMMGCTLQILLSLPKDLHH